MKLPNEGKGFTVLRTTMHGVIAIIDPAGAVRHAGFDGSKWDYIESPAGIGYYTRPDDLFTFDTVRELQQRGVITMQAEEMNVRAAELAARREKAKALRIAADELDNAGFPRDRGPTAWLRAQAAKLERSESAASGNARPAHHPS